MAGVAATGWRRDRPPGAARGPVDQAVGPDAAPEGARARARVALRSPSSVRLLRLANGRGAHLQVDSESYDTHEATMELALDTIAEEEFRDGPSAGVVVQAYLRESGEILDRDHRSGERRWAAAHALAVRLVKGAYWDAETAQAAQHGWPSPVFSEQGRDRPQLRGVDGAPDRRQGCRAAACRVTQPTLDRPRDRRRPTGRSRIGCRVPGPPRPRR